MKYLGLVLCTVVAFHACVVVSGLDDRDQITQETLEEVYKKLSPHCVDEVQNQVSADENKEGLVLSAECQKEIQSVLMSTIEGKLKTIKEDRDKKTSSPSDRKNKPKRSKKKQRSGAIAMILGFIFCCIFGLLYACYYINHRLEEAGLHYLKEPKKPSKQKKMRRSRKAD